MFDCCWDVDKRGSLVNYSCWVRQRFGGSECCRSLGTGCDSIVNQSVDSFIHGGDQNLPLNSFITKN